MNPARWRGTGEAPDRTLCDEDATMGLLPPPPSATAPAQEDVRRATALLSALRDKKLAMRRVLVSKWADEFRLLRSAYKPERVDAALEWYCHHVAEDWVPQAFSAAGFRSKFDDIAAAAVRHERRNPTVVPSSDAEKYARDCLALTGQWPKGCSGDVPALAQLHLDAYVPLWKKFHALRVSASPLAKAADVVWLGLSDPSVETPRFLHRIHKRVCNWPDFHGKLLNFRFDPAADDDFQRRCRGLVGKWFGSEAKWAELWREVSRG